MRLHWNRWILTNRVLRGSSAYHRTRNWSIRSKPERAAKHRDLFVCPNRLGSRETLLPRDEVPGSYIMPSMD